jgi:hypothetical protein
MTYPVRFNLLPALLLLALLPGCNLSKEDKDTVVSIEPEFTLDFNEKLGTSPSLLVEVKSIEQESCLNFGIISGIHRASKVMELWIQGIAAPSTCEPGLSAAFAEVEIGALQAGEYDFAVSLKNAISNKGKLRVNDNLYQLDMETEDGILLNHKELRRIPEYTIWGYVSFNDEEEVGSSPTEFLLNLDSLTTYQPLGKGYYGHFDILENSELRPSTLPTKPHWKTFVRRFDRHLEELQALLETYRNSAVGDKMEIKLFTWQGDVL